MELYLSPGPAAKPGKPVAGGGGGKSPAATSCGSDDVLLSAARRGGGGACGGAPRARVFLVMAASFVVAAAVILVVVLTTIEPSISTPNPDISLVHCLSNDHCSRGSGRGAGGEESACTGVAVVGAGLAGSYTAWRLRAAVAAGNLSSVALYELSERVGGRLLSRAFSNASDVVLELGAAQYDPRLQPRLHRLVRELGLATAPAAGSSYTYHLRGTAALTSRDLQNASVLPYNLDTREQGKAPIDLLRDYLQEAVALVSTSRQQDAANSTAGAHFANDMSIRTALLHYASQEAYDLVVDSWGAAGGGAGAPLVAAASAAHYLQYVNALQDAGGGAGAALTLARGMDALTAELVRQAARDAGNRFTLRKNMRLYKLEKSGDIHRLYFHGTKTEDHETVDTEEHIVHCAHHVVLALPPAALASLVWDSEDAADAADTAGAGSPPPAVAAALAAITTATATKLFLHTPPTNADNDTAPPRAPPSVVTDIPVGEVQPLYSSVGEDGATEVVNTTWPGVTQGVFTTDAFASYWLDLVKDAGRGDAARRGTYNMTRLEAVLERLHKHLGRLRGAGEAAAADALLHHWDYFPYRGAWQVWRPNVDWTDTAQRVLKPLDGQSVYVVGAAFAPGQLSMWLEGAVHTADALLTQHLDQWADDTL